MFFHPASKSNMMKVNTWRKFDCSDSNECIIVGKPIIIKIITFSFFLFFSKINMRLSFGLVTDCLRHCLARKRRKTMCLTKYSNVFVFLVLSWVWLNLNLCFVWRKRWCVGKLMFLFVASDAFPIFYFPIVYFPFVPLLFKHIWINCLVSFYSNAKFPWFRNSRNPVRITSKL